MLARRFACILLDVKFQIAVVACMVALSNIWFRSVQAKAPWVLRILILRIGFGV